MSELAPDYWLNKSPAQPKREIAGYVASEGFNVPRIFTFDEALFNVKNAGRYNRSVGEIIMRSEHPDELAGASGLFESETLSSEDYHYHQHRFPIKDGWTEEDFLAHTKAQQVGPRDIGTYAGLIGEATEEFMGKLTYSYWEKMDGVNLTVVADTAIENTYHLLASSTEPMARMFAGTLNNEGLPIASTGSLREDYSQWLRKIVETYEDIRRLPRFNANNCPIMELQLLPNGQIYFLQYHHTRRFESASESLDQKDFDSRDGWIKADLARGAVGPTSLEMSWIYPETDPTYGLPGSPFHPLPTTEQAVFDADGIYQVFNEVMARRRIAFIDDLGFTALYRNMAEHHYRRSQWFKSKSGLVLPETAHTNNPDLLPREIRLEIMREAGAGKMARVLVDYASDGRRGYIRLNPEHSTLLISGP